MYNFKFADIGEGIHEGKILEWKFKKGDKVNEGDTLVIVETDKVNAELPSPVSGIIVELGKAEGELINVGETVVIIDDGTGESAPEVKPEVKETAAPEEDGGATVIGEIEVSSDIIEVSTERTSSKQEKKVLATPVARNLAKQLNVNINDVPGSGPQGRVTKEDIKNYNGTSTSTVSLPNFNEVKISAEGDVRIEDISSVRKTIANAMTKSKTIIPETILFTDVVVDKLVELRNKTKTLAAEQGISLTYLAFIAKAVLIALKEFPIMNSSFDHNNNQIIYKNFINLGFAVDTPNGLLVPNIKNANYLSILNLAKQIRELADKSINRTIQLPEIQNGTFTITNFGSVGVPYGAPVINHPEVAILGVGRIDKQAIVVNDEIKIGHVLPLSLAVDHRIIDGADAGRFLNRVKQLLNEPDLLMLG